MGLKNPQHERFAVLVATSMSPVEAWKEVYPTEVGTRSARRASAAVLARPGVTARIRELQADAAEKQIHRALIDQSEVIGKMIRVVDVCMQEIPVVTAQGEHLGATRMVDPAAALRGLEKLGLQLGLFVKPTHRSEEKGDDLDKLPYDEIAKIAERCDGILAKHVREHAEIRRAEASAANEKGDEPVSAPDIPPLQ